MNYNIFSYIIYLAIVLFVILRVGHTLYRNGRPFVIMCLDGNVAVADAVNKILLVGYYLINMGYAVITLRIWEKITSMMDALETLSYKIGFLVLLLGVMHFINVGALLWRRSRITRQHVQMIKKIQTN